MAFVTVEDVKAQLNITTAEHDIELADYAGAAGRVVERHLNKIVESRSFTEQHRKGFRSARLALNAVPITAVTSVERVDGSYVWDIADLKVDPDGVLTVLNGPWFHGHLTVTFTAGMAEPYPEEYVLAGKIIAQHLWMTQRGGVNVARVGASALQDSTILNTGMGFAVPNRALELLGFGSPGFA